MSYYIELLSLTLDLGQVSCAGNPGGLSLEGRHRLSLPAPAAATDLRPALL